MLNSTLLRIAADLDRNGIAYAVIGAIALNQHGYQRLTVDIDLLLTKEGLQKFRDQLVGRGYFPAFAGATREFKVMRASESRSSRRENTRATASRSQSCSLTPRNTVKILLA